MKFKLIGISVVIMIMLLISGTGKYFQSQIKLNEICSDNESYTVGEEQVIEDYIELYNEGNYAYTMKGLYLSDDQYDLKKISLEGYEIGAKEWLTIVCRDSNNSFAINNKGETIYLSDENGNILDFVEVDKLEGDTAYTRMEDEQWCVGNCTPGAANEAYASREVDLPVLSHEGGFYDESFDLTLSSAEGTSIYYSVDGSEPDENSSKYEEPIMVYDRTSEENIGLAVRNVVRDWQEYEPIDYKVPKAFILRAVAIDAEGNKSDVVTSTYFIGQSEYKNQDVVSLVTDYDNLFDSETGIYVTGSEYDEWYLNGEEGDRPLPNFRQKGKTWERPASFEFFSGSEKLLEQNVGIRIQGAGARENWDKRFSIYARKEYSDSNYLEIPFFGDEVLSHSIVLRNGRGDCVAQELLSDRGMPWQRYREVAVFVNGEYYYTTYIREKYSEEYFHDRYGIDKDNLVVIKSNTAACGVETDMVLFRELYEYIDTHDFSKDEEYYALNNIMDLQSYIDFLVTNIYLMNVDVEVEETKNVVMWRTREATDDQYSDGRWRFALYDMDTLDWMNGERFGVETNSEINVFENMMFEEDLSYNEGVIYTALKKNPNFAKQFVLTCCDMMNTYFRPEYIEAVLSGFGKGIESYNKGFFVNRSYYMKQHMEKEFGLTGGLGTITLRNEDVTKGTIVINTIEPEMTNGIWMGEYYTEYPVIMTAYPKEGYEFVGWSGDLDSTESTIEISVKSSGVDVRANFQKIEEE